MKNLLFFLVTFATFSCSPPDTKSDVCIDKMLENLDMEHYSGVIEGECRNYLQWFTHEGSDYFMLDNPCADFVLHLWDCEKLDVCSNNSGDCQTIMTNMTNQGLVGRDVK